MGQERERVERSVQVFDGPPAGASRDYAQLGAVTALGIKAKRGEQLGVSGSATFGIILTYLQGGASARMWFQAGTWLVRLGDDISNVSVEPLPAGNVIFSAWVQVDRDRAVDRDNC